mgnify:CR=1 FL=1
MNQTFLEHIEKIVMADQRYAADAYAFVMEALAYTQKRFGSERHVTGEELLEGIRELVVKEYGFLAVEVLHNWGVRTTEDLGHIVFNLVDHGILGKQEDDSFDSFRNGFDFTSTLGKDYRRQLTAVARRMR